MNSMLTAVHIAIDPNDQRLFVPETIPAKCKVLDVGCGAGHMLRERCSNEYSYGLDISCAVLLQGKRLTNSINFICGRAEALPFSDCAFDVVCSRVALPYTNIPISLSEI